MCFPGEAMFAFKPRLYAQYIPRSKYTPGVL